MPHSRNASAHSHIVRENSPPEEPIGLAADRVDEGAGHARGRQQDDFRLAGAFDIPPAYEERHGRSHSRSHSRARSQAPNASRSRSRHARSRSRNAGSRRASTGVDEQSEIAEPTLHAQHEQAQHQQHQRNDSTAQDSAKHLPELGYGHAHGRQPQTHDRSVSGDRRRDRPIGLGSDRINEGTSGATRNEDAGQTYTFSTDGSK